MDLTIASLLDVVERLGWIGGKTDLLTYPEYVLFKGIDTLIDEKRIRLGLKLNVYATPFDPKALIQESSIKNHENINGENQERNKNTSTKHNNNTKRQTQKEEEEEEEKWVEVSVKNSRYTKGKEKEMKTKEQRHDKSSLTKKKTNKYQELKEKEEEEEEENKIEEDSKVEIKTKAIDNVNSKHDWNDDSYHIEGVSMETLEKEIDQQLLNDTKNMIDEETNSGNLAIGTKEKKNENIIVDIDSIGEEETDDDETTTGEDENMIDDEDSNDSSTIEYSSEEESSSSNIKEEEHENEDVKTIKEEYYEEKLYCKEKEEEERLQSNEERDHKMRQLLYQNDLLLFRLEQAEINEEKLREELYLKTNTKNNDTTQDVRIQKQLKDKEEEWKKKAKEYENKIETVEKALAVKTKQLIDQLRRKK